MLRRRRTDECGHSQDGESSAQGSGGTPKTTVQALWAAAQADRRMGGPPRAHLQRHVQPGTHKLISPNTLEHHTSSQKGVPATEVCGLDDMKFTRTTAQFFEGSEGSAFAPEGCHQVLKITRRPFLDVLVINNDCHVFSGSEKER